MADSSKTENSKNRGHGLVFGPTGHCIYCGASGVHLGREHVVPYGLQGDMVLLKSSCDNCAKITGNIENFVLGQMLIKLRVRYGIRSRKKSKNKRPKEFEFFTEDMLTKTKETKVLGFDYLPWYEWTLPIYDLPGLLLQKDPQNCTRAEVRHIISKFDAEQVLAIGNGTESVATPLSNVNISLFNRFLAKIAHSYLCAVIGQDNFEPFLKNLILNGEEFDKVLVGCIEESHAEPFLFKVEHCEYTTWNGQKYIAVHIRLFAFLGTPTYVVAAGKRRCGKKWFLSQPGYALPAKVTIMGPSGAPLFSTVD